MIECVCGGELDDWLTSCRRCGRYISPLVHLSHDLPEGLPKTGRETDKE